MDASDAINDFRAREDCRTQPYMSKNYGATRPKYERITEDPDYLKCGGALKEFQLTGLNWLAYLWSKNQNGILADEVRSKHSLTC